MTGREANRDAWNGYVTAFPDYVIYPGHLVDRGDDVLVLGTTTGSHLGLPDQEERQLKVIWRATVQDGLLTLWQIIEDTPGQRALLGLTDVKQQQTTASRGPLPAESMLKHPLD